MVVTSCIILDRDRNLYG